MVTTNLIPNIVSMVTRREGGKFLRLDSRVDETSILDPELAADRNVSLYIHIPFCRTLCPFCCFNRYLYREDKARRYFKYLRKELDLYKQAGYRFTEFYFGGGTPTVLMDELMSFIDYLKQSFQVQRISLETTAREITAENIELLKQAGINRLSIGVQSFDEELTKAMGRTFLKPEETKERLLMAQGNFDTLNMDLVFNFPGQTIGQLETDVATFKELNIDQATFYPLMASPHKKNAMERKFNRVDFSREGEFYDVIMRELYNGGYTVSTAWCFSRGNRMIDEYIIDFDDYIGIGAGSVSILNGNFFVNSFALQRYESFLEQNRLPVIGIRTLTERENQRYYLLTKLFGMEVEAEKFFHRFNASMEKKLAIELLFFKTFGLVEGKEKLRVTPRGMYPVSVMMREFFAALNGLREYCIENQV
jgi:coproporphyrinogen III oxidase-like Fe-S oxidoreductase